MGQSIKADTTMISRHTFPMIVSQIKKTSVYGHIVEPVLDGFMYAFFSTSRSLAVILILAMCIFAWKFAAVSAATISLSVWFASRLQLAKAGINIKAIAVNGLFLGLAIAAFIPNLMPMLITIMLAPLLLNIFALAGKRLLLPWNLPILVLPYMLTIWGLWYVSGVIDKPLFDLPSAQIAEGISAPVLMKAYFRGFSEMFFIENEGFGLVVFTALLIHFKKIIPEITLAAAYSLAVPVLLGANGWIVQSGLTIFPAVFAVLACNAKFDRLERSTLWLLVGAAPFAELAAIRIGFVLGLPAISLSYLLLIWIGILCLSNRSQTEKKMWSNSFIK